MLGYRYAEWIAVWEWFQTVDTHKVLPREKWDELYALLDLLWVEERRDAKPEELAAHAAALAKLRQ
jgi:hypothetical protein